MEEGRERERERKRERERENGRRKIEKKAERENYSHLRPLLKKARVLPVSPELSGSGKVSLPVRYTLPYPGEEWCKPFG